MNLSDLPYDELRQVFAELDYEEAKEVARALESLSSDNVSLAKELCFDPEVWAERARLRLGVKSETFRHRSWLDQYLPMPEGIFWGQMRYAEVASHHGVVSDSEHFVISEEVIYRLAKDRPENLEQIIYLMTRIPVPEQHPLIEVIGEQAALNGNYPLFQHYFDQLRPTGDVFMAMGQGSNEEIARLFRGKFGDGDRLHYFLGRVRGGQIKTLKELGPPDAYRQMKVRAVLESGNADLLQKLIDRRYVPHSYLTAVLIIKPVGKSKSLPAIRIIKSLFDQDSTLPPDDFSQGIWRGALEAGDVAFLDRLYQEYPLLDLIPYYLSEVLSGHYAGPVLEWLADRFGLEVVKERVRQLYQEIMTELDEDLLPEEIVDSLAVKAFVLSLKPADFVRPTRHPGPEDEH